MRGRRLWWRSSGLELHPLDPYSIPPEALMRVGFIGFGHMAQAMASQLPTVHQFTSAVLPALPKTAAAERGRSRTGEHS
jgi:hypothetical protein